MPIYEYECGHCGERLTRLQKTTDARLTKCPVCDADRLRKLLSAAAFHLKGSGWYVTDFKGAKPQKATETGTDKQKTADGDKNAANTSVTTTDKADKKEQTSPATE